MSEYYDGIGQVSFNSSCGTQCPFDSEFKMISAFGSANENTSEESSSYNFKDLCLKLSNVMTENNEEQQSFKVNSDYYFDFYVEAIENFQTTIDLQLVNLNNEADTEYQFIRSFKLPVGINSKSEDNLYRVIFFQKEAEDKLSFVKENSLTLDDNSKVSPKENVSLENDQVYELISNNSILGGYYYCTRLNDEEPKLEKIQTNFSTALLRKTWKNEIVTFGEEIQNNKNLIRVRGIFSPLRSDFNAIRLKIVRATEDFFLSSSEGDDIYYGRILKINEEKSSIYELTNLLGSSEYISETEKIDKIGIWANPGLMFSLNGEELQVGPTGYYELDILPITRIGVAAFLDSTNSENEESLPLSDDFTIDYQYKKVTES